MSDTVTDSHGRVILTEWEGLEVGDRVTLRDERKAEYKFLNAVMDPDTGKCLHINLIGGKIGRITKKGSTAQRKFRAVFPEKVNIPGDKELHKQRALRARREREQ